MTVAVIGVGQSMRGDDGAGPQAVLTWQQSHAETARRPDVRVAMMEGAGLDLVELLEDVDGVVLVDAVRSNAPPGTLYCTGPEALSDVRDASAATHGWSVGEVLKLVMALMPESRKKVLRLVGVEAAQVEWGEGLSAPVRAALGRLSNAIEIEVRSILQA